MPSKRQFGKVTHVAKIDRTKLHRNLKYCVLRRRSVNDDRPCAPGKDALPRLSEGRGFGRGSSYEGSEVGPRTSSEAAALVPGGPLAELEPSLS